MRFGYRLGGFIQSRLRFLGFFDESSLASFLLLEKIDRIRCSGELRLGVLTVLGPRNARHGRRQESKT